MRGLSFHVDFVWMATQVAPGTRPEEREAQPRTIPRLWQDATAAGRTRPAYLVERDGAWEPVSWSEAATAVEELANGLLWLALAAWHGPSLRTFVEMAFVTALLILSLIDLDHQLLPDVITLPGVGLRLAASFLPGSPVTPLVSFLAAAGGWLAFALVAKTYEKTRGVEGLGQGDWKLAAMLGAFLGWQKMLLTVLLASVAGTVVGLLAIALRGRDMRYALPLGTFLGGAGVLVVFLGDAIVAWYRGLFGG